MKAITAVSWVRVLSVSLIVGVVSCSTQDKYDAKTLTFVEKPFFLADETLERSLPKSQRYNPEPLTEAMTAEIALVHHNSANAIESYIKLSEILGDVAPLKDGFAIAAAKNPYYSLQLALAWLSIEPSNQKMHKLAMQLLKKQPNLAFLLVQRESNEHTVTQLINVLLNDGLTQEAHTVWLQAGKKFPQGKNLQKLSKNFM